ncbi:MAG TPA: Ig-like domain-containing protein [Candidatus Aquicultor sp.]|jgi:photosystem II stability/assembly factor-like uncharacterized protein
MIRSFSGCKGNSNVALKRIVLVGAVLGTLLVLLVPELASAAVDEWVTNGPSNTIVYSLSASPDYGSDRTVFAGTDHGIYKTTNGGQSWSQVGLPSTYVESIAISPTYTNDFTVFAGTIGGGIYKSANGGASWTYMALTGKEISALCISPNYATDHTVFASTTGSGVYKSTDSGTNWTQTIFGMGNYFISALAISPDFAADQTVFAATIDNHGIYKSTNSGSSWTQVNTGLTRSSIRALAISPAYSTDHTIFADTFCSVNGGANWAATGLADDVYSLIVSPGYATNNTVFAGTYAGGVYRTTNSGTNWTQVNTDLTNLKIPALAIANDPQSGSTLFAGTWNSGVFSTLTQADITPPNVVSADPVNGATGIASNKTVTITFSENIQTSIAYGMITVKDSSNNPVAIATSISNRTLTITVPGGWGSNTTYTVIIPAAAVKDMVVPTGNNMATQYTLSFTTQDTTAPAVSSADPVNGVTAVAVNKTITITFSEPIQVGTAYNSIALATGGNAASITKSISGSTLSITPLGTLNYGVVYTLTVPAAAVRDATGNVLAGQYTLTFTTGADTEAPTVSSTLPASGAATVATDTTVSVTFSENIVTGAHYDEIALKDSAGTSVPITKSINSKVLNLKPSSGLTCSTVYTVTIPAGAVKDSSDNNLVSAYTLSFTITPNTTPPAKPTGLAVAISTISAVEILWNQVTDSEAAGYYVYRKIKGTSSFSKISSLVTTTRYQDTSAEAYLIYVYYVTAVNRSAYESAKSSEVEAAIGGTKGIFVDVAPSAWYRVPIFNLTKQDVLSGYTDGTFKPNKNITRAEFAKLICLAAKWSLEESASSSTTTDTAQSFRDVAGTSWMYTYVETAKVHGVISGYRDGAFKPNKNITRAEMAKMIATAFKLPSGPSRFRDVKSNWARGSIYACIAADIVNGYADGTFKPNRTATRAEAAKMMAEALGL